MTSDDDRNNRLKIVDKLGDDLSGALRCLVSASNNICEHPGFEKTNIELRQMIGDLVCAQQLIAEQHRDI